MTLDFRLETSSERGKKWGHLVTAGFLCLFFFEKGSCDRISLSPIFRECPPPWDVGKKNQNKTEKQKQKNKNKNKQTKKKQRKT